ncbi:tumor necrosis factor receptor superfamily member 6 isoform X4 [Myotis daubentonii]|uniref:tumor necrosis factor receptor superfamily member 6 isoform X4 n=1 Tax=Myotis daubentonii TaxID=98922 RepID=UPI002873D1B2|nr:tumor necrosis factor receptor superfamily member 6 isoform X4 [Myotis daubentonii]
MPPEWGMPICAINLTLSTPSSASHPPRAGAESISLSPARSSPQGFLPSPPPGPGGGGGVCISSGRFRDRRAQVLGDTLEREVGSCESPRPSAGPRERPGGAVISPRRGDPSCRDLEKLFYFVGSLPSDAPDRGSPAPGERKKDDCKADGDKLVCEPCSEGKEYTDEEHYSPTCRRCGICDGEHGVKRRRRNNNLPPSEPTSPDTEMLPVISSDIDLTDYISTIAELMTISEVRDFVRKNGLKEAKIDEIKNDNLQNTAEQKVQLLRNWYQVHGKKDAFTTLITGLKKIKLCAHADKIKDIVLNDITSKRENTNITNENESQRCKLKIVIN